MPMIVEAGGTSALIKASLVSRYGKEFTNTLQSEARQEYEKLIPEIPYIRGSRARMLNSFLLITAQELAAYKAMKKHFKPPGEAWEVCHEALRFRLAEVPQWKRWLIRRFMFSRLVRKIVAKRAKNKRFVSATLRSSISLASEMNSILVSITFSAAITPL